MSVRERLDNDFKEAMRSGDNLGKEVLRMVRSEIRNKEIEKGAGTVLDDSGIESVISSAIKKRKESARMFLEGGRQELADKESAEAEFLQKYLPEQLSEEEVREKVKSVIESTGAQGMKEMGKVMKTVMAEVGNAADGSMVSKIVKELLS